MSVTAVITQPTYLPWLGYFEQMARADVFVFLDNVQFTARSWQCRNRLAGPDGAPFWLTVPVAKQPRETLIRDVRLASDPPQWREKHLAAIRHQLGTAPFFSRLFPEIEEWLTGSFETLANLNMAGLLMTAGWLGLTPVILRASDLEVSGRSADLLVSICQAVNATNYYSALGSKSYIDNDPGVFARSGIELSYQNWSHPVYDQGNHPFVSHLAAIDAILRVGPDVVREWILP